MLSGSDQKAAEALQEAETEVDQLTFSVTDVGLTA
jgi:hypothetical protein